MLILSITTNLILNILIAYFLIFRFSLDSVFLKMGEEVGTNGDQSTTPLNDSQVTQKDEKEGHLEKMTDYKSYAKVNL